MSVPGCYETVTWLVINKPLIVSRQDVSLTPSVTPHPDDVVMPLSQMYALRKIMQGDSDLPKAPMGNNFRPIQPMNQRFLRTNIDFRKHPVSHE